MKLAADPAEATERARDILGMDIKGHTVRRVLLAPAADIAEEYYFSFLVDRANRNYLCIASTEGGVEIEEVAHSNPDAIAKVSIDPATGVDEAKAVEIVAAAGFPAEAASVVQALWEVFIAEDASLVEVNPLVKLADGSLEALDGKVTLDENAAYRHPDHAAFDDKAAADPLEAAAQEKGLNYVKLDGSVGIIGNGAGLVMSTLDVVAYAGEAHGGVKPANFLDIGGGASAEVMKNGLSIILGDPQVRSVFVNVFGGITACDAVSNGIVQALELLGDQANKPLVVRLDGNNVDEGRMDPREGEPPAGDSGRHHGRRRRSRRRAGRAGLRRDLDMAIFLTEKSRVVVQGMTGSEGQKHTSRMLAAGTNIVGGVTPGKGGQSVDFAKRSIPVYDSCADAVKSTGADVSIVFVPPRFTKGAVIEAVDAGIPLVVVITEGVPVHDTAAFFAHAQAMRHPDHRAELPRPDQPRPRERRHHPGRHRRSPAGSAWCRSPAR